MWPQIHWLGPGSRSTGAYMGTPWAGRRARLAWAEGPEVPNLESPAKCSDLLDLESLTPWGTPTSI